ncbi:MAG: MBL fold metallo-hydrolase [Flavobacteriaceae bacterium]|nr:MBL fold metallo-hydrolase [Flavobacteriaceae bacterium]
MKITYLGTGTSQGIPVIGSKDPVCLSDDVRDKRLRVALKIEVDDKCFVIDCGPDFRQQMLQHKVETIDALLFTHEHADHTAGLDDIRPYYFKQGSFDVYLTQRVLASVQKRFYYMFTAQKYPGAPSLNIHLFEDDAFNVKGVEVLPIPVSHGFNWPVTGFRIQNFAYITDMKEYTDDTIRRLQGVKVLTVNALRKEVHHSHLNLDEALEFIEKVKPEKAYLTHISHKMGFHADLEAELPEHIKPAYDGLSIEI